ncbi:hypothetical protein HMC16_05740 [Corynebacterium sp. zg-915]|uniref:Uncharacterized protein n=1 Tax=Corynebacterium wankanglinii TaxID=2735136 RepID=A0A838CJS3_9CORY|nr:hypothetical protein [Corynebacterium wankanglinii]
MTNAPEGPCSSAGVPLDRRMRFTSIEEAQKHDYAWHRVQSTGNNWADFVTAPATPGSAGSPEYRDVTEPVGAHSIRSRSNARLAPVYLSFPRALRSPPPPPPPAPPTPT